MDKLRPSTLPNLRLVQYAIALNKHRSFVRAARAMRITQPTLSRGIAALEKKYEARFFDRSSRQVKPTPEGELFLERAEMLLADAAKLRDAVHDYRNLGSGRIKVGVGPYALEISVIETVTRLASRHPRLQIELVEGNWRGFGPKLLAGEIEFAVSESAMLLADQRFEVHMLPSHRGYFFCRSGHPVAGRSDITLAEILEYPLVGISLPIWLFRTSKLETIQVTQDENAGDIQPHYATNSIAMARAIVQRTNGIGMATQTQLTRGVSEGRLVMLDTDTPALTSSYGIGYLKGRILTPSAQAFIEVLKEVEAEIEDEERRGPSAVGKF